MKFYLTGNCHHKNIESLRKTLHKFQIQYEEHANLEKLDSSFDVALCFSTYYPPSAFPTNCKVVYGPHFFVVPDDKNHPLYHHTYDTSRFFFNTLSPWVNTLYREFCDLNLPFINAFFGIDTEAIHSVPIDSKERTHVMLYYKGGNNYRFSHVKKYLETHDIPYHYIKYGSYNDAHYKELMKTTKFIIWIDAHESQGFALQEALASNIPLLVWDVNSMFDELSHDGSVIYQSYKDKGYKMIATCAPYWSDKCGIRFTEEKDFVPLLTQMEETFQTFRPRDFIEETLSLEASMKNLLTCIGIDYNLIHPSS